MALWKWTGKQPVAWPLSSYRCDLLYIEQGDIVDVDYDDPPPTNSSVLAPADWERIDDPRERPVPTTAEQLAAEAKRLFGWIEKWIKNGPIPWAKFGGLGDPRAQGVRIVLKRLEQLIDVALRLGMTEVPDLEALTIEKALAACNKLRTWAQKQKRPATGAESATATQQTTLSRSKARKKKRQRQKQPVLTVDLRKRTITWKGKTYNVDSVQALRWVKVLAKHPDEWISASELEKYNFELKGARPDRLKKYLPSKILSLIESNRRKGSRFRPT